MGPPSVHRYTELFPAADLGGVFQGGLLSRERGAGPLLHPLTLGLGPSFKPHRPTDEGPQGPRSPGETTLEGQSLGTWGTATAMVLVSEEGSPLGEGPVEGCVVPQARLMSAAVNGVLFRKGVVQT